MRPFHREGRVRPRPLESIGAQVALQELRPSKARAYYDAHKDEMRLAREAARQAAYEADLERSVEESRAKVAAAKKLHRAQQRAQADYLRSIGVL